MSSNTNLRTFYVVSVVVGLVLIGLISLYANSLKNDVASVNSKNNQQVSSSLLVLKNHIKNLILYTEVIGKLEARASIDNAEKANNWAENNFESFLINVPELFGFALVDSGKIILKAGFQESAISDEKIRSLGKPKSIFPARLEVRQEFSTNQSKIRLLPLTQRIVLGGRKIYAVVFLSAKKLEELINNSNEMNVIHSSLIDNAGRILVSGIKGKGSAQDELERLQTQSNIKFSDIIASKNVIKGQGVSYLAIPVSPFPINIISIYRPVILFSEQLYKIIVFSAIVLLAFTIFIFFYYRTSTKLDAYQGHLESLVDERTQELEERTSLLQTVLASMTVGIVAFNKDLKLIAWNEQFLKIRDYPKELIKTGTEFSTLMDYDDNRNEFGAISPEMTAVELIERSEKFEYHEFERLRPDGRYIEVRGGPIPGGGFVSTYTDISERKENEKMLNEAYSIISDSIDYAANIQRSILPNIHNFAEIFEEYCVLWEPRDRVGGDMYWLRKWGDGDLVLLGDCTGHGVPGAFMTLIVTGAIDSAIESVEPGDVGALLQSIHQNVQTALSQDQAHGTSDDGFEVGACFVSKTHKELIYAGARFSLFKIEDDDVIEIKGTKKGIGYRRIPFDQSYDTHKIKLNNNQTFILTTDGLIDQIGGKKRIMFGKRRFKELLLSLQGMPLFEQKFRILEALAEYQGFEIRRDDMALIGFKLKQDQNENDYTI